MPYSTAQRRETGKRAIGRDVIGEQLSFALTRLARSTFLYVRLKFSRLGFPWEAKNEIDCGIGGNFWKKVGDISDQRQLSFMEVVLHGFISIPGKVNFPVSLGSKLSIWPRFILKTKQWNAWSCERSLKVFCPNLTVNEAKSDRCEVYIDLNHSSSSS